MSGAILCLNAGSSSLKFDLFDGAAEPRSILAGAVSVAQDPAAMDRAVNEAFRRVGSSPARPTAVVHRVVFGGAHHDRPQLADGPTLEQLRALTPFAPLHLPAALQVIEAAQRALPSAPNILCFDSMFHCALPPAARHLPLPASVSRFGVRRYGFHGLSYESVVDAVGPAVLGRGVIAHLGHGASMAAISGGRPIDTTMGLTPMGGLMMSTRSGDLDPGVLVYLMRHHGFDAAQVEDLCLRQAGLLGISGSTGDMRDLLARRPHDERAALAVEMFCYGARKQVGAYAAALGGLDTLVFTGGIGEHAAEVRAEICAGLDHLGVTLDDVANRAHRPRISAPSSACAVLVVPARENLMMARHARALMKGL